MAHADDLIVVGDARGVRRVRLAAYLDAGLAERAEHEANAWVKSLRGLRIDGLSFRERFTHRGDSLWWFAELYLHKMQVANRVFRTLLALEALVERERPAQIGAAGPSREVRVLARRLAEREGVAWIGRRAEPCAAMGRARAHRRARTSLHGRHGVGPRHEAVRLPQPGRRRSRRLSTRPSGEATKSSMSARSCANWKRRCRRERSPWSGSGLKPATRRARGTTVCPDSRRRDHPPRVMVEAFASRAQLEPSRGVWRRRREIFSALAASQELRSAAVIRGCDAWPLIEPALMGIAYLQFPWSARVMDQLGAALDALKPSAVVTYAEAGGWGRAMVLEARRRGIASVGLQHGFIYRHWLNYLHEPDEMAPAPGNPVGPGLPVPDAHAALRRFRRRASPGGGPVPAIGAGRHRIRASRHPRASRQPRHRRRHGADAPRSGRVGRPVGRRRRRQVHADRRGVPPAREGRRRHPRRAPGRQAPPGRDRGSVPGGSPWRGTRQHRACRRGPGRPDAHRQADRDGQFDGRHRGDGPGRAEPRARHAEQPHAVCRGGCDGRRLRGLARGPGAARAARRRARPLGAASAEARPSWRNTGSPPTAARPAGRPRRLSASPHARTGPARYPREADGRTARSAVLRRSHHARAHHRRCRFHRVSPGRRAARRGPSGDGDRRPVDRVVRQHRPSERPAGLQLHHRHGDERAGPGRTGRPVRRRVSPRRRGRRAAHRRIPGADPRDERARHGGGAEGRRQEAADGGGGVHLRGVRQERRGAVPRGRRHRAGLDGQAPVGVRLQQGAGRVPGAGLLEGEAAAGHHRALLQHRRAPPDGTLRDGRPELRASGAGRGAHHGVRRRDANPLLHLCGRRRRRAHRDCRSRRGARQRLQRREHGRDLDLRAWPSG